jgi:hypothetical protein
MTARSGLPPDGVLHKFASSTIDSRFVGSLSVYETDDDGDAWPASPAWLCTGHHEIGQATKTPERRLTAPQSGVRICN